MHIHHQEHIASTFKFGKHSKVLFVNLALLTKWALFFFFAQGMMPGAWWIDILNPICKKAWRIWISFLNLGGKAYRPIWNHHPLRWQKVNFSEFLSRPFPHSSLRFIQVWGNWYQDIVMEVGWREDVAVANPSGFQVLCLHTQRSAEMAVIPYGPQLLFP